MVMSQTCVILPNSELWCWGNGFGVNPAQIKNTEGSAWQADVVSLGGMENCVIKNTSLFYWKEGNIVTPENIISARGSYIHPTLPQGPYEEVFLFAKDITDALSTAISVSIGGGSLDCSRICFDRYGDNVLLRVRVFLWREHTPMET